MAVFITTCSHHIFFKFIVRSQSLSKYEKKTQPTTKPKQQNPRRPKSPSPQKPKRPPPDNQATCLNSGGEPITLFTDVRGQDIPGNTDFWRLQSGQAQLPVQRLGKRQRRTKPGRKWREQHWFRTVSADLFQSTAAHVNHPDTTHTDGNDNQKNLPFREFLNWKKGL